MKNLTPINKLTPQKLFQARRCYIIYALRARGLTVSDVARKMRLAPQAVSNGLRLRYPKIERMVSKIIGVDLATLFPERYDASGRSLVRPGRPPKNKIAQIHRK
jgi:lambda repressor-like predicted transcriptional regulator